MLKWIETIHSEIQVNFSFVPKLLEYNNRAIQLKWKLFMRDGGFSPLIDIFYHQKIITKTCSNCQTVMNNFSISNHIELKYIPDTNMTVQQMIDYTFGKLFVCIYIIIFNIFFLDLANDSIEFCEICESLKIITTTEKLMWTPNVLVSVFKT